VRLGVPELDSHAGRYMGRDTCRHMNLNGQSEFTKHGLVKESQVSNLLLTLFFVIFRFSNLNEILQASLQYSLQLACLST
jgi:hypothetical protein